MPICMRGDHLALALALETEEFEDIGWKGCICACRCVARVWGGVGWGKNSLSSNSNSSHNGSRIARGKNGPHRPAHSHCTY